MVRVREEKKKLHVRLPRGAILFRQRGRLVGR
jgi:hypothetical protein